VRSVAWSLLMSSERQGKVQDPAKNTVGVFVSTGSGERMVKAAKMNGIIFQL